MIKHGLLICSFQAKKKYSVGEKELYNLNNQYSYDEYTYSDIFEMMKLFMENYQDYYDDEKLMKMFAISQESIQFEDKNTYSIMSCIVLSGAYGIESKMTNKNTKEVVYTRTKEDADIKQFQMLIYVPKDVNGKSVSKGIVIFETIGNFGVKTITIQNMKQYFSEKFGLTLFTRSVSVRIFIEKLLKEGKLSRLTLINNKLSVDASDSMFLNSGREEKAYIKPRLKDGWIKKILNYIDGNLSNNDIFEIDDVTYDDIKLTFSHTGHTRTVSIMDLDSFSIVEDAPESIYPNGDVNRDKMKEHMEKVAQDYASKMIFSIE